MLSLEGRIHILLLQISVVITFHISNQIVFAPIMYLKYTSISP